MAEYSWCHAVAGQSNVATVPVNAHDQSDTSRLTIDTGTTLYQVVEIPSAKRLQARSNQQEEGRILEALAVLL